MSSQKNITLKDNPSTSLELCESVYTPLNSHVEPKEPVDDLPQKIEFVLDDIFRLTGFKRKEIGAEEDEVSASDSDY